MLVFDNKVADHASVQFRIIGAEPWFLEIQSRIPEESLFQEYGRETRPHVTILYGLRNDVTVSKIQSVLENIELPEVIEVFGYSLFTSNPSYDVLKIDVIGPEMLWNIHNFLKVFPVPGETFPDYKPHVTLAYLKKGWYINKKLRWNSPIRFNGFLELSVSGIKSKI
jgi:2'-5' RNA ligase